MSKSIQAKLLSLAALLSFSLPALADAANDVLSGAIKNDTTRVTQGLQAGGSVDTHDASGNTALIFAARNQNLALARLLLEHKADPNLQRTVADAFKGWSALHFALAAGQPEMVQLLLQNGANPNLAGSQRLQMQTGGQDYPWYPLDEAVKQNRVDLVSALLKQGAKNNTQAIVTAVEVQNLKLLEVLLAAKLDVNMPQFRDPPLVRAIRAKASDSAGQALRLKIIEALLAAGADTARPSEYLADVSMALQTEGVPPLTHAIRVDDLAAVRLLLKAGARSDLPYEEIYQASANPLEEAGCGDHPQILTALLDQLKNQKVIHGGDTYLMLLLHLQGACFDFANPLLPERIRQALGGSSVNQANQAGKTSLSYAVQNGDLALIKELAKRGADFSQHDKARNNLLHQYFAAPPRLETRQRLELVSLLLQKGIKPSERNAEGKTAIDLAWDEKPEMLKLLKSH